MSGPSVGARGVTFRFPDPDAQYHDVALFQEVTEPRPGPALRREHGAWTARLPRPRVDRMEYLFEVLHPDGGYEMVLDPTNPRRAQGAFGWKSVVEFPEYTPPAWLGEPAPGPDEAGELRPVDLGGVAAGMLWSPPGVADADPLPLLVVHDGVEYAEFADLRRFLDVGTRSGLLPPLRAALLHPLARDDQYSANPAYTAALTELVLPRLAAMVHVRPGRRHRVGMGASLGALAMLHAHRLAPAAFGGLFLQSGSFFHHRYVRPDLGFEHFARIRAFMDRVHGSRGALGNGALAVPVAMTCGEVERNFPNNRATGLALRAQGYPVTFTRVRDAHTWVGWRDAFVPGLVELLKELWS